MCIWGRDGPLCWLLESLNNTVSLDVGQRRYHHSLVPIQSKIHVQPGLCVDSLHFRVLFPELQDMSQCDHRDTRKG